MSCATCGGRALMADVAAKAVFQRERAHALWGEIAPLLVAHKEEVAHYPDIPLEPDVDGYNRIEDAGGVRCYTARVAGELVGYCVVFVHHNLHYKSSLQGLQDVLFLRPDLRASRLGAELVRFTEHALRPERVQVLYQHVKAARREGVLFQQLGYELVDHIWAKRLDREEG